MAGSTLPERVAQIYYTYGLFISSYPITAITLALSVVLLCCFPLLNVPLPGNIPATVVLPLYEVNNGYNNVKSDCSNNKCPPAVPPFPLEVLQNETQKLPHVWAKEKPLLYVQQIVMKIGVSPWTTNLKMWDAFRAPLQESFRLLETVRNHEDSETKTSLAHRCYQIEGIKRSNSRASVERLLPEYGCLLLSPANLWQQNLQTFSLDANILNTIHNYHKGKVSISEMAFGMHLRDTGMKRYPLRRRPRVLQYAVTVFFEQYDQRFLQSLSAKLHEQYPLYQEIPYSHASEAALIYYPGQFNYRELVPLVITFFGLFLYVYFSVRKIEFINSKFGLAACAVTTIAGSLAMSMGICFYFGFSLSLQGKEIFPYLVIIVGLENVLVLTKSVTGTDARLDVKIRLAQGLSKEGWSITKNLLTEITIFTVSFFTFVPFIQEFSIFMIVSLLSDYFVQMVYFATILGIDVRRNDYFREQNSKLHLKDYFHANNAFNWRYNQAEDNFSPQRMTKSKSHPRLNGLAHNSPTDVVAKRNSNSGIQDQRVPKRIRLVNLWARTRFFQRAFMVWMIVWISMIVYNSDIVDYFIARTEKSDSSEIKSGPKVSEPSHSMHVFYKANETSQVVFSPLLDFVEGKKTPSDVNDTILLKHSPQTRPWSRLSPYHWSSILSQYNQSVAGRYAVVLPPLLLSHRVSPELAASVRNPDEREPAPLRWQALAAALDPIDIMPDFELIESKAPIHGRGQPSDLPIYPTTPMEILLLAILCSISVAVIAYMMVVLYRCICSRHYAEWRASWNGDESYERIMSKQPAVQLVMEAVPIVVSGHVHEVECIATDGEKIVSSCLQGNVKVWDSQNGDSITNIDRARYFKLQNDLNEKINSMKESNAPDIEEVTLKQDVKVNEKYPRLRKGLDSHLSGLRFRTNQNKRTHSNMPVAEKTKYEFAKNYRELYCSSVNDEYYNNCETKDNLDISSNSINKQSTSYKDSNSNESSFYSRVHNRKVNGSINNSEVLANREVLVSNSELGNDTEVLETRSESRDWSRRVVSESPVWCMDLCNDLIVLGCGDGRLEFWEANRGKLLCVYWSESRPRSWCGVTHVRALSGARRVLAASLSGHVTLLRLHAVHPASGAHVDWTFSTAHRPKVSCFRVAQCRAHQQPITELQAEGGRLLTGGQDHVLKVFSSAELSPLFTLHGHCGPITSSFIDHTNPNIAGSGSQDGLLCVWDLLTGACLYSTQAHDGSVTSLAYTASYVISAGSDERLCIWDRFQGHMLNSVHIGLNYMSRMLPLTHSLLLMGDRSGLVTYDLSTGDVIRRVLLSQSDGCIFVRQILPLKDAIVCDYANQLRIVRFPLVSRLANIKND